MTKEDESDVDDLDDVDKIDKELKEEEWDSHVEGLSSVLENLGIKKTCEVIRLLLNRHDLAILALVRAILDVDPEALGDKVDWKEKYA